MRDMNVLEKKIYRICAVICQKSDQEVAVDARKFFLEKQIHQTLSAIPCALHEKQRCFFLRDDNKNMNRMWTQSRGTGHRLV